MKNLRIALTLGMIGLCSLVAISSCSKTTSYAKEVRAIGRLKNIYKFVQRYAERNEGALPIRLGLAFEEDSRFSEPNLTGFSSGTGSFEAATVFYFYYEKMPESRVPIAASYRTIVTNQGDLHATLMSDGQVEFITCERFDEMVLEYHLNK